jgi:hypothetical protein
MDAFLAQPSPDAGDGASGARPGHEQSIAKPSQLSFVRYGPTGSSLGIHQPRPWGRLGNMSIREHSSQVALRCDMIQCSNCGNEIDRAVASISGSIMGDEYIESYYRCPRCDLYTVEVVRDRFLGEAEVWMRGPLSRAEGDSIVEQIRQCSEPRNKRCRCDVHREYFGQSLD